MPNETTLYELAKEACDMHNNIEDAKQFLLGMLNRRPALRKYLMEQMVESAVQEAIYDVRHHRRREAKFKPGRTTRGLDVIMSVSGDVTSSLLDVWSKPDGTLLGDILGSELPELIEDEKKLANGHAMNVAFLSELAKRTPPRAKIRNKVTPAQAQRIWWKISGQQVEPEVIGQKKKGVIKK